MDFISLPDEMIANCLKYSNVIEVTKLRKISKRISKIVKAYNYGERVPVEKLWLRTTRGYGSHMEVQWPDYFFNGALPEVKQFFSLYDENTWYSQLLMRIEITDRIAIQEFRFEDSILDGFEKYHRKAFRFATSLEIRYDRRDSTVQHIRRFINLLPSLNSLRLCEKYAINLLTNSEILCERKWNSLSFICTDIFPHDHGGLNNDFLIDVAVNCDNFNVELDCAGGNEITIAGALHFIEMLRRSNVLSLPTDRVFKLGCIQNGLLSVKDVKRVLRLMNICFEYKIHGVVHQSGDNWAFGEANVKFSVRSSAGTTVAFACWI